MIFNKNCTFFHKYTFVAVTTAFLTATVFLFSACKGPDLNFKEATPEAMYYSCVTIYTEGGYGSGVIIEINDEEIVVASNLHVLSDWNENGYVVFANSTKAFGQIFGADEARDVCFLSIPLEDVYREYGSEPVKELRAADFEESIGMNEAFKESSDAGSGSDAAINASNDSGFDFYTYSVTENDNTVIEGRIVSRTTFFYELDRSLMEGRCADIKEGMSGAPIFNEKNELCGIICAGGDNNIIACVGAEDIQKAYMEALIF